jgi:hypothetical protein
MGMSNVPAPSQKCTPPKNGSVSVICFFRISVYLRSSVVPIRVTTDERPINETTDEHRYTQMKGKKGITLVGNGLVLRFQFLYQCLSVFICGSNSNQEPRP